jgi:hypothetical protein
MNDFVFVVTIASGQYNTIAGAELDNIEVINALIDLISLFI